MASEACFFILTTPAKAHRHHHSTQSLTPRSFAARLKTSTAHPPRPFLSLASSAASKPTPSAGFGKKAKKKVKDDPWESLFQQLEEDLEKDTEDSNEDEITEEDVANFEKELDMVVQDIANVSTMTGTANELDDMLRAHRKDIRKDGDDSNADDEVGISAKKGNEKDDDDEDDDAEDGDDDHDHEGVDYDDEDFSDDDLEDPRKVTLQRWQLRKLAAAAELGRRKVNIKSLAAELQLDREDVLHFLKEPPPELLMVASEMEEEDEQVANEEEIPAEDEETEVNPAISVTNDGADLNEVKEVKKLMYGPRDWMKGKRIKKVNIATLERVYKRSKWPSNAMIESIVQATNLPRMRVLEWFEEERAKSGVRNAPRQSSASRKNWKRPITHSFERLE